LRNFDAIVWGSLASCAPVGNRRAAGLLPGVGMVQGLGKVDCWRKPVRLFLDAA
jgi:hypothetical protein